MNILILLVSVFLIVLVLLQNPSETNIFNNTNLFINKKERGGDKYLTIATSILVFCYVVFIFVKNHG